MRTLAAILTAIFFFLFLSNTSAFAAKRVEINLNNQQLIAFDDSSVTYSFTISSGKPWWPTPTGTFTPYAKLLSTRMKGGDARLGTAYDLPNVPYTVYFYGNYAIHGTYWHNNFGVPMSHGCVNLRTSDAKLLYNWIDYSTPITVYGNTPAV